MPKEKICPKCASPMVPGILHEPDGKFNLGRDIHFAEVDKSQSNFFTDKHGKGKAVKAYCCKKCGFLEFYVSL